MDIDNLCICDNIELKDIPIKTPTQILPKNTLTNTLTTSPHDVVKVSWGMFIAYVLNIDGGNLGYYEILSTLECQKTYTIVANPPQSKIISKNSKIFEDLSNKSQIDLNSLFNSTNNINKL
jgi:hypothetical protein